MERIIHPIPPVFDERSRVLVLGSMPSPTSRALGFNYGHPQNRFWRVMAHLAGEPVPATNERKRDFCLRHHIALWDVLAECEIEGASDASIRNARANDLASIVQVAPIEAVFCTGAKAHEFYVKLGCEQACGLPAVKLPSTRAANAAWSVERLAGAYARIFEHTHEWEPPVLDVPDVVALEQRIAADGTSLAELMDRAGAAVAHRVQQLLTANGGVPRSAVSSSQQAPFILILAGNGNNGGDGWVAAELLTAAGVDICVVTTKAPSELTTQPARDAALRAEAAGVQFVATTSTSALRELVPKATVVVDALFGCGLRGGITR
ncbi:MAG: DNA-deoxyinosine glycosylase, partial [Coriobacteriales bacterium]|nr:DNA-deoxyinosine glycosylase [Coriobacteriales bacterium]